MGRTMIVYTCDLRPGMIASPADGSSGQFLVYRVTQPSNNLVYAVDGWLDEEDLAMTEVRLYATLSREWQVLVTADERS